MAPHRQLTRMFAIGPWEDLLRSQATPQFQHDGPIDRNLPFFQGYARLAQVRPRHQAAVKGGKKSAGAFAGNMSGPSRRGRRRRKAVQDRRDPQAFYSPPINRRGGLPRLARNARQLKAGFQDLAMGEMHIGRTVIVRPSAGLARCGGGTRPGMRETGKGRAPGADAGVFGAPRPRGSVK